MPKQLIEVPGGPKPGGAYSPALRAGDFIFVAGQGPTNPASGKIEAEDIEGQTRQVLAAIDKLLAAAGTDKTRILRAQIFLADINDFAAMNSVWDAWVPAGHTPARATVEAKLAAPEYKVEIVVTAAV